MSINMFAPHPVTGMQRLLQWGAVSAVLGTVANIAASVAHGDLPEHGTQASLRFVAARASWSVVHLVSIIGVLLWVAALVALAHTLVHDTDAAPARRSISGPLAQLGTASALIGAAIHIVFFSIDGYALKHTADAWAAAPMGEQAALLQAGDLVLLLQNSQFVSAIAFLLGLPFVLFGLAVVASGSYPTWLGWLGVSAGAGAFVTGVTRFVGSEIVPDPVLFGVFGLGVSLWMGGIGVLLWQRARRLCATSTV